MLVSTWSIILTMWGFSKSSAMGVSWTVFEKSRIGKKKVLQRTWDIIVFKFLIKHGLDKVVNVNFVS